MSLCWANPRSLVKIMIYVLYSNVIYKYYILKYTYIYLYYPTIFWIHISHTTTRMSRMHRIVLKQHSLRSCISRASVQATMFFLSPSLTCISLLEATFLWWTEKYWLCCRLITCSDEQFWQSRYWVCQWALTPAGELTTAKLYP